MQIGKTIKNLILNFWIVRIKDIFVHYYYYWYSALGPVWAETRAQSGDWYAASWASS